MDPQNVVFDTTSQTLETQRFITKVYGWMSSALLITGLTSVLVLSIPELLMVIIGNKFVFYGLILAELGLVVYLSAWVKKMSATTATFAFLLYAVLNGLTLSIIFLVYTFSSIASAFFVTAATFGVMSAYGYYTKKDLTSIGTFCFMGLIGIIIASVVNLFLRNDTASWIISYLGVLIFIGLTAYDTQKIKRLNIVGNEGTDEDRKEAITGALTLYLDFINLFLHILRLMGKRR